jgi:hypothetical protein
MEMDKAAPSTSAAPPLDIVLPDVGALSPDAVEALLDTRSSPAPIPSDSLKKQSTEMEVDKTAPSSSAAGALLQDSGEVMLDPGSSLAELPSLPAPTPPNPSELNAEMEVDKTTPSSGALSQHLGGTMLDTASNQPEPAEMDVEETAPSTSAAGVLSKDSAMLDTGSNQPEPSSLLAPPPSKKPSNAGALSQDSGEAMLHTGSSQPVPSSLPAPPPSNPPKQDTDVDVGKTAPSSSAAGVLSQGSGEVIFDAGSSQLQPSSLPPSNPQTSSRTAVSSAVQITGMPLTIDPTLVANQARPLNAVARLRSRTRSRTPSTSQSRTPSTSRSGTPSTDIQSSAPATRRPSEKKAFRATPKRRLADLAEEVNVTGKRVKTEGGITEWRNLVGLEHILTGIETSNHV